MSSSQGPNANTLSVATSGDNYEFTTEFIRDASDWIKYKKETRKYTNYKTSSTDNKDTEPVWIKYGNQFRLTYSLGRWKCKDCGANAFSGKVGDETLIT